MRTKWTQSRVGLHWSNGDYHISKRVVIGGKPEESGYALYRNRAEVGLHRTLQAAKTAAAKLYGGEAK